MTEAVSPDAKAPLVSARGISKQFASIEVLHDVDLDLERGEIHALLGENGAGKSTFAKILAGVHRPSRGTLMLNGQGVEIPSPLAAQKLGVSLIHQEPISFPDLSVAENLVLGRSDAKWLGHVPWAEMTRDANRLMDLLGVRIDVTKPMRGLSIADQQMVEIARALASDSRLIIMDEPTAPLTPKEVATLFAIARRLRGEGRAIVFISHRLEEVRALCDRVTIFRDGNKIVTDTIGNLSDGDIIRLMIGRPLKEYMHKQGTTIGEVALSVENLTLPGVFSDISFTVRKGEVVGLGGLVGAGRTDVARAIFGVAPAANGTVKINGEPVSIKEPDDAIALGLAFVPEDRAAAGIFRTLPVEQNITAAVPKKIAPSGIINRIVEKTLASDAIRKLSIRLASP
ncbi:MAG: sugar ABC transporter ATP-binding protein, partial [Devosia sp.]